MRAAVMILFLCLPLLARAQPMLDARAVPGLDDTGRIAHQRWLRSNLPRAAAIGRNGSVGWVGGGGTLAVDGQSRGDWNSLQALKAEDAVVTDADDRVRQVGRRRPRTGGLLLIDRPEDLRGHLAGGSGAFSARLGDHLLHLGLDPAPPAGC